MKLTHKFIAIVASLLLTSTAFGAGEKRKGGKFKELMKEMNLSEEQLAKIKEHRLANKGKMKPLREQMKTLREEMDKAFLNGASDGELTSLNSRLKETQSQMNEFRFSKMLFFKNILTPEQRQKWQEKKKGWKGKFKDRMKKRFKDKSDGEDSED